ncbi:MULTISPECIES: bifunctional methylenetetrahydrofolate dehydrogenase/methenyltetrahydrofolate cyclohydrolase FolD [Psychrilyobacter]|uniref:Bifunctional protein FolD n=1 Tax=Psychrilyobacter piezotolerans TaxID=2293438 RepID=A0ABX9KLD4_9FUSO|nr:MULTISPECIES: bifunctional methylenetetrahydrofolate dehydrogenase/methenyltetrahydrofolate cyclohydrolase FolD [Psychrilyobacter]MCS5421412.1 bifunctional methylenetetrahydrofolate dehydrogenase/methenyltetrahydrofolate cyclohydrolase FolD [Psychrilyobacter sp. S5]NDI76606.1 bifunctional methylenetetrahydrofolate dehydrogenase/methenyltetrahydrofolate cyclohydrolase FolD [Psychrilyobacter piezotolerans]RDE65236.1 bifunctional methylenetetrahydrofolate dehydrogenase/methenyltetrahydrofolate c
MIKIIDGKKISAEIKEEMKIEIEELTKGGKRAPGLAVIIVGENPASKVYVNSKVKTCSALGIYSEKYNLDSEITEAELLKLIEELNNKEEIDGILVQLPLPKHIDEDKIIEAIKPNKDVDGFHPINLGKLVIGKNGFKSCTPYGIMELLKRYELDLNGKDVVIVGRSNIVGKPLAVMLTNENATVTLCHSKTKNLSEKTLNADIVIVAIGREKFLTEDMVKEGSIVIDVGINRNSLGKLCGDVDFENVSKKTSLITPVPGGVGPMTIAMLMKNTVKSRMEKI